MRVLFLYGLCVRFLYFCLVLYLSPRLPSSGIDGICKEEKRLFVFGNLAWRNFLGGEPGERFHGIVFVSNK
nr:hypothetical protein G6 - Leishmania tarentolae mitochondrion [Leishmania tarentolae]